LLLHLNASMGESRTVSNQGKKNKGCVKGEETRKVTAQKVWWCKGMVVVSCVKQGKGGLRENRRSWAGAAKNSKRCDELRREAWG